MSQITLLPDQVRTYNAIVRSLQAGYKRPCVQAPTGFGKTVLAAKIIEGALAKGNGATFIVDAITLVDQTLERFAQFGITDVGVLQGNHPATDISRPVQIASAQTLARRDPSRLNSKILLVDEAHCQHKSTLDLMQRWTALPFIGLSATPWAKGMANHWDTLIRETSLTELIENGRLSPYRLFAVQHPDLTGVKTVAGDYQKGQLGEAMQRGSIVADMVGNWIRLAEGRPTLAFGVNRAHANHIQREFESRGIPCGYVDAYTEREERKILEQKFHSGELPVVASVGCLTKGVDWDVRCILLARPTKSEMLYLQIVGRGLRTAPGKTDCLILDHSDTSLRLGLPEDVEARNTELDDGTRTPAERQKNEDEPLPKVCPKCAFVKPPKTHQCPACGFAPEKLSDVEEVEAELVEITKAQARNNRNNTPDDKRQFFAELLRNQQDKGYKEGWASHKYKRRFGVWPNAYKDTEPAQSVGPDTASWLKSEQIRFAKRRTA